MNVFLAYTAIGLIYGSAYAIAASGLVLTYTTTRVFNIGHGAIGMLMAYVFWQLTVPEHMNRLLALLICVGVLAPALGIAIERIAARNLGTAPVSVSLVVTIGLFVLFVGVAQQFWNATTGRTVSAFFNGHYITVGSYRLTTQNAITIVLSVVIAAALYVLLNRTRLGTSMRAAVDNRELLGLFGGNPTRVAMTSWAMGSSLAALAGIMLVSTVGLSYYQLTFLVVDAFAAAVIGRLTSLPMTFVGAILIGLGQGYTGYLPQWQLLADLRDALPTIVLFVALIFLPQVRLRVGQIKGVLAAPVPTRMRTANVTVLFIVLSAFVAGQLSDTKVLDMGEGVGFAIVMLSLVLLTGYGGYVSMAQMSFMGLGAAVVCKLDTSNPFAVVFAIVVCAAAGALVALPVLRLTGLYLALATFAFAQLMDDLVFQTNFLFGFGGVLNAQRPDLFGYNFGSTAGFVTLMTVVFALIAVGLLAVRRGAIGRILVAMRDSQIATGTLGLNQRWIRVGIFSAAAGIAGLGGALMAGLQGNASATPFDAYNGLELLLLAVIWGVTSMSGAYVGGMALMLLPIFVSQFKTLAGLESLLIGGAGLILGRDPNGIMNYVFTGSRMVLARIPLLARLAERPEPRVRLRAESEQVVSHGAA